MQSVTECVICFVYWYFLYEFLYEENEAKGKNNSANSEYSYSLYDYLGDFKCVE